MIEDVCYYLKRYFDVTCFGDCGREKPFDDGIDVEDLLDECGEGVMLTGR